MVSTPPVAAGWWSGLGREPLVVVFELTDQLDRYMRDLALKAQRAVMAIDEGLRLLDETFLENAQQVIGRLLEVLLAVVAFG
jgi:hypothetical protein